MNKKRILKIAIAAHSAKSAYKTKWFPPFSSFTTFDLPLCPDSD